MALIEEARSQLAGTMGEWAKRRMEIVEKIARLRDGRLPGELPGPESFALVRELKELTERMKEVTVKEEWLESQMAGKKYAVGAVQMLHVRISI